MNCRCEGHFNPSLLFQDLLADEIHYFVCDCVPNSDADAIMEKPI